MKQASELKIDVAIDTDKAIRTLEVTAYHLQRLAEDLKKINGDDVAPIHFEESNKGE